MGYCCADRNYRWSGEEAEKFLNCESVKEFYSKNGLAEACQTFLREIRNVSLLYSYLKFYGNSNAFHFFEIDFGEKPENFGRIKDFGIEFKIERIMTSRDNNHFYQLDEKGFSKLPAPNNYQNI